MSHIEINLGNIEAMFADPSGPVGRIIEGYAVEVEATARALMLIPGSGGIYLPGILTFKRGSKLYSNFAEGGIKSEHQASAPGMPASNWSGQVLASISHHLSVDQTVYGVVGSPEIVAGYLSRGTRYMAARPFLQPALFMVV